MSKSGDGEGGGGGGVCLTANEGPVRIQYKCLVPIYVFPRNEIARLFRASSVDLLSNNILSALRFKDDCLLNILEMIVFSVYHDYY